MAVILEVSIWTATERIAATLIQSHWRGIRQEKKAKILK